jgi:aspartate 1-decarboxylase
MALRTSCKSVDLTGVEVKEIKHIAEGSRFRTYVLVALPTGDANVLRKAKEAAKAREQMAARAPEALKELQ